METQSQKIDLKSLFSVYCTFGTEYVQADMLTCSDIRKLMIIIVKIIKNPNIKTFGGSPFLGSLFNILPLENK